MKRLKIKNATADSKSIIPVKEGTKKRILGITVAVLLVAVCAAIGVNWYLNAVISNSEKNETYQDGGYFTGNDDSYFDTARYTRRQARDEAISVLKSVVNDEKSGTEAKLEASLQINDYAVRSEQETMIENQIAAKGYEDCIVFVGTDNASVVVKTDGLEPAEAARIIDIVVSETKLNASVIKIIELK